MWVWCSRGCGVAAEKVGASVHALGSRAHPGRRGARVCDMRAPEGQEELRRHGRLASGGGACVGVRVGCVCRSAHGLACAVPVRTPFSVPI